MTINSIAVFGGTGFLGRAIVNNLSPLPFAPCNDAQKAQLAEHPVIMPIDPTRVLSIIRELDQASPAVLLAMDRELLLLIKHTLEKHKREVDKVLSRLAFADEQQLN